MYIKALLTESGGATAVQKDATAQANAQLYADDRKADKPYFSAFTASLWI